MELNITLEEAYAKASPGLRRKMQHSVELIRKAERAALIYDKDNGFWVGVSGGKDSQVVFHLSQLAGVRFKAHFTPTSVDPPQVIRFLKTHYPEVEFIPMRRSIYQAFKAKKLLPSLLVRWCCAEFKENRAGNKVVIVGVRHDESVRRADRDEVSVQHNKFSGNIEDFYAWGGQVRQIRLERIKRRVSKAKYAEYVANQETMIHCVRGKDQITISPILEWTDDDVWEFLNNVAEVPHCELYDLGFNRVGCIFCPMSNKKTITMQMEMFPYVRQKWIKAIKEVREERDGKQGIWAGDFGDGVTYTDDEIAEMIFDYWQSHLSIDKWRERRRQKTLF